MSNIVVTVDGMPFSVEYQGNMTPAAHARIMAMAREQMQAMGMGGCSSCGGWGGGVGVMAATGCPGSVNQGERHTISIMPTGGKPPFTYSIKLTRPDGAVDSFTTQSVNYTFAQAGNYALDTLVTDSCGTPQSCPVHCVINSVGAGGQKYDCVNGSCVAGTTYPDLASCQNACHPPPPQKYDCVNHNCVAGTTYPDLASCQNACPPPPPAQKYDCVGGNCVAGTTYPDLASCQAACKISCPTLGCAIQFG